MENIMAANTDHTKSLLIKGDNASKEEEMLLTRNKGLNDNSVTLQIT